MPQLVKTYYDISKFVLWSDSADDNSRKARLVLSFRDGNPRITVYAGGTVDSVISFPSDIPTIVSVFNYMKEIAKSAPGTKIAVESLTTLYQDNKPTKEKKLVSTLYIGKSKEGLVYLSVISEGKPKLVFTIKSSDYHTFKDSDKNNIPADKISEMMAIGMADMALNIVSNIVLQYTNEEYSSGIRKVGEVRSASGTTSSTTSDPVKNEILQDLESLNL